MKFEDTVLKSYPTGSRYICNPAPTDTDNDTVVLVNGYYDWEGMLYNEGWDRGGSECGEEFNSFRKGEENYIVTESEEFFQAYIHATEGARALNLLKKEDRIELFQAIKDADDGFTGLIKKNIDPGTPFRWQLRPVIVEGGAREWVHDPLGVRNDAPAPF